MKAVSPTLPSQRLLLVITLEIKLFHVSPPCHYGHYYGVKAWIVCAHALWDPDNNVMIPFEPFSHEIISVKKQQVNTVAVKGLFTWRWGTPGRWSPLRGGNPPVNVIFQSISRVNVTKLKWEIIWTGRLLHLSGLPHLPGVPTSM